LRPIADQELVNGINRFVIHESAHQPLLDMPRMPHPTASKPVRAYGSISAT
jgi:hypothetical protein